MSEADRQMGKATGKTRRVTITELARITGRSESTWRKWLREPDCALSVELGGYRGGSRERRGQVRLIDLEGALRLHEARGGDAPHEEYLPEQSMARLEAELIGLRRRLTDLEELVFAGGAVPSVVAPRARGMSRARPLASRVSADARSAAANETDADAEAEDEDELDYPARVGVRTHHLQRPHRLYSQRDLLPFGLVGLMDFMQQHGARQTQGSTFSKAIQSGRLRAQEGEWLLREHRTVPVGRALDRAGRQRAWELWHTAPWFARCPYCPHTVEREQDAPYVVSSEPATETTDDDDAWRQNG